MFRCLHPKQMMASTACALVVACSLAMPASALAQTDEIKQKIAEYEQKLAANPEPFDWRTHNELRHLYGAFDERRSVHHSNIILRHALMDDYILDICSDWMIGRDCGNAIRNLDRYASRYGKDMPFLAAACWLKAGDLEKATSRDRALAWYRKVQQLKAEGLDSYRALAQKCIMELGQGQAKEHPAPSVANTVWTGSEDVLKANGVLGFGLRADGKAAMHNEASQESGLISGTWTQTGAKVEIRFPKCRYRGQINQGVLSGKGEFIEGKERTWNFEVKLEPAEAVKQKTAQSGRQPPTAPTDPGNATRGEDNDDHLLILLNARHP
jgi:hypothetical protein